MKNNFTHVFDDFFEDLALLFAHQSNSAAAGQATGCAADSMDVLLQSAWHRHVDHLQKEDRKNASSMLSRYGSLAVLSP